MKRTEAEAAQARCEEAGTHPLNFNVNARTDLPAALEMLTKAMLFIKALSHWPCAHHKTPFKFCEICCACELVKEWEAI